MPVNKTKLIWGTGTGIVLAAIGSGLWYWKWVLSEQPRIDFVMEALTIVAFVLAFVTYFDAKEQGRKLGSIYESVYTKFGGVFPEHLEILTRHIELASSFVYVIWDAVDIGSYVQPATHRRFYTAVLEAAQRIQARQATDGRTAGSGGVRFLLWGEPRAITRAASSGTRHDRTLAFCAHAAAHDAFQQRFPEILRQRHPDADPRDFAPFVGDLRGVDFESEAVARNFERYQMCYHDFVADMFMNQGVEIHVRTPADAANFFWVADDGKGGINGGFLLLTPSRPAPAFSTSDPVLIDNLLRIFRAAWESSDAAPYRGARAQLLAERPQGAAQAGDDWVAGMQPEHA